VVAVHGRLVGDYDDCSRFRELMHSLRRRGAMRVVIDLADAPWANSIGVGMLVGALWSWQRSGGELVLAAVPERIRRVLEVTRLNQVFRTFHSAEAALGSAGRDDAPQALRLAVVSAE